MIDPKLLRLAAELAEKLHNRYALDEIRFVLNSEPGDNINQRTDRLYIKDQYDDQLIPVWEVTYSV